MKAPVSATRVLLGSIVGRVAFGASSSIAIAMLLIGVLLGFVTAGQWRDQVARTVREKAAGVVQAADAFDTASVLVVDRLAAGFAGNFAADFGEDDAGELRNGGERLRDNFTAVDRFSASTGGVATVFARQGDDFVRLVTSLRNEDGGRAQGTLLGSRHPAYAAVLAGKTYTGRDQLFGKPFLTHYQPMRDGAGKVVALLFTGFDLSAFKSSLDHIVGEGKLFDSGGLAVIDPGATPADAVFVAHPSLAGRKVIDAVPGTEATLRVLTQAGDDRVDLPTPLIAQGSGRWGVVRKTQAGWWVVAEVADDEAMATHHRTMWALAGLLALAAMLFGGGLWWSLRRHILRPLNRLGDALAAAAQGEPTRPGVQQAQQAGASTDDAAFAAQIAAAARGGKEPPVLHDIVLPRPAVAAVAAIDRARTTARAATPDEVAGGTTESL